MNRILMEAVIDLAVFLELSGDDVLNPDVAISQLELLAATLQGLTQDERKELIKYVEDLAASEKSKGGSEDLVNFLTSFPEAMGLKE